MNVTWYTTIDGATESHRTKRAAVTRIRNALAGTHSPIVRSGHSYTVFTKGLAKKS